MYIRLITSNYIGFGGSGVGWDWVVGFEVCLVGGGGIQTLVDHSLEFIHNFRTMGGELFYFVPL